ncbi:MAG: CarD-like/TRCF domain protein [Lachnospiraceae bacterium]|nr:CarD-like/TRCF domain protein [Lachnospiraceae bacterium]MDE6624813.1 CarD-like/TRCF domain protein [Lachnospiraceae bacterium]
MFEKKDIIFSEALGVCRVAEVTKLTAKSGEQVMYYGLRSMFDDKKISYIPVEHHQVILRPLISAEEAQRLSDNMPEDMDELRKREIEYVLTHKVKN